MSDRFRVGETVVFDWGRYEIRGRVREIYGPRERKQVVLDLEPELSSYVVDEPTTLALPIDHIRKAVAA